MFTKPLYKMTGKELEMAARSGPNPEALLALSVMVAQGWRGCDGDEDRALELEKQAAAMGHPRALCKLGDRYARGDVVEEDHTEAIRWWRRAAEAGDVGAMTNLIDLRESLDPREAAEGEHWLKIAASRGQPYAVNIVNGREPSTMVDFANLSLEEMAARAPAPSGNELTWQVDSVKATFRQMNDFVGLFVERLRAHFFDVHTTTTIDGDGADFPQPDVAEVESLVAEENTIEVMIYAGPLHLQINLFPGDTWSIDASSFEPHPSPPEQTWLKAQIRETMTQVGLRV